MMMVVVRIMMKKMPTTTWSVAESCSGPELGNDTAGLYLVTMVIMTIDENLMITMMMTI